MRLRTRERKAIEQVVDYVCRVQTGPNDFTDHNRQWIDYSGEYSHICDEHEEKSTSKWGYCPTKVIFHLKEKLIIKGPEEVCHVATPFESWPILKGDLCQEVLFRHGMELELPSMRRLALSILDRVNASYHTDELNKNAMSFFRDPTLDQGFSLLNFLWELREIGMLFGNFRAARQAWRSAKRGDLRSLGDVLNAFASGKLAWDFGIAPLLRDLYTLMRIINRFKSVSKRLADLQGKRLWQTLVTFQVNDDAEFMSDLRPKDFMPTDTGGSGPLTVLSLECGVQAEVYVQHRLEAGPTCVMRNGIGYSYMLPEAKSMFARVHQFMDALGVRGDAAIIWNAIPFTFLIDWCCGISGYLHEMSLDTFPCDVTLSDCMNTASIGASRMWWLRIPKLPHAERPYNGGNSAMVALVEDWVKVFERKRVKPFPERIPEPKSRALGLREITLGGALAYTMGYRVYRRKQIAMAQAWRRQKSAQRRARPSKRRHYFRHALDPKKREQWISEASNMTPLRYRRYLGRRYG